MIALLATATGLDVNISFMPAIITACATWPAICSDICGRGRGQALANRSERSRGPETPHQGTGGTSAAARRGGLSARSCDTFHLHGRVTRRRVARSVPRPPAWQEYPRRLASLYRGVLENHPRMQTGRWRTRWPTALCPVRKRWSCLSWRRGTRAWSTGVRLLATERLGRRALRFSVAATLDDLRGPRRPHTTTAANPTSPPWPATPTTRASGERWGEPPGEPTRACGWRCSGTPITHPDGDPAATAAWPSWLLPRRRRRARRGPRTRRC